MASPKELNDSNLSLLRANWWIIWDKREQFCIVSVYSQSIVCVKLNSTSKNNRSDQPAAVLNFDDIIGCASGTDVKHGENTAYLNIFAYPLKKKLTAKCKFKVRQPQTLTIVFETGGSCALNQAEAMKWKAVIDDLIKKYPLKTAQYAKYLNPTRTNSKRLLVLINPFSGPGKAPVIFKNKIIPMFEQAGIDYKAIITERAGHGREFVQTINLKEWYGIIVVSGDGLIFETVNGLMERDDWEEAIKMPIGTIPGGSGNALSSAIMHSTGESYLENHPLQAGYVLAKHTIRPLDLTVVDTCKGERLHAFLSVAWGLVSDVDIDSERWRYLGSTRFLVGAVTKILSLKKYRGRLSFLPVNDWDPTLFFKYNDKRGVKVTGNDAVWRTRAKQMTKTDDVNGDRPAPDTQSVPMTKISDCAEVPTPNQSWEHNTKPEAINHISDDEKNLTEDLPPLSEPVPSNWLTFEEDFILAVACFISHLGEDNLTAPDSKLNDGVIYLFFVRPGVTRLELLLLLEAMKTGKHVASNRCEMIKIKAFRLEPLTPKGMMTVDGEAVDYGPIQGRVSPGLGRLMAM